MYEEELHDIQVGIILATYYRDDQTKADVYHVTLWDRRETSARAVWSECLKERYVPLKDRRTNFRII